MTTSRRHRSLLAALILVSSPLLRAQASKSPAVATTDETVRLSEFTVSESTDNSYVAAESITGTRVRTPIKDLTFTVNVITSEFLNDFAYFEINDLGYTSSVNNFDNGGGNVNMRGYGATSLLRNGVLRLGLACNVGVTYTGQTYPDSTAGGITEGASSPNRGFVLSNDGRRALSLPSYTIVDAGLSYRLRPADSKFAHTLRLNVKNLTDLDYIDTQKRAGDRRGYYVTYAINH